MKHFDYKKLISRRCPPGVELTCKEINILKRECTVFVVAIYYGGKPSSFKNQLHKIPMMMFSGTHPLWENI